MNVRCSAEMCVYSFFGKFLYLTDPFCQYCVENTIFYYYFIISGSIYLGILSFTQ